MSSTYCLGSSSRIKVSLFLLLKFTDELILVSKKVTFLPILLSANENSEQ